ncbi:MAG: OmpH family outer membrane protein [Pseudomonadota bacterium]
MFHLKPVLAVFVFALTTLALGLPAYGQGTKIVVVDQERVLSESRAGQDMRIKFQNIEGQMQRELQPTAQSLEQLGATIEARTANITPEAARADVELQQQARDYQARLRSLSQESDRRSAELAMTQQKAGIAFRDALKPVLDEVMQEQGAQIMLAAGEVMIALPATDVTDQVIQKLDATTPSINVTRERLPTQAAQQ